MMNCYDVCVADFPRLEGETDDSGRLQRAIDACPEGVLYIPKGFYEIAKTVRITNFCSLQMHKSAQLRAVAEMDFVLEYDGNAIYNGTAPVNQYGERFCDQNIFIQGGDINGNGLASCLSMDGYIHVTIRDITCRNGKKYGLYVGDHGYELIVYNAYFRCTISGMAGNTAIYSIGGDSHYTDCIAVDYTIGVRIVKGGSNRLTRCHIWGGPLPALKEGEDREMLKDSIGYHIGGGDTVLRDCYADTSKIGFLIEGDATMSGCAYFSNPVFHLDHITAIKHEKGNLTVEQCRFTRTCDDFKVYEGTNKGISWNSNYYCESSQYANQ